MRVSRVRVFLLCAVLLCTLVAGLAPAGSTADTTPANADIAGTWTGSKLRCQKEEGKLVRCGTPSAFAITFEPDGSGSSPDEAFPRVFSWRWISPTELGVIPRGEQEELKLFGLEREDTMLTFQAYLFLPTSDPNQPAESRYIHYVYDLNLVAP